MTEKQWLKSTDPRPMLERLGRIASDRQLRLFACACARRVWHLLVDERSRTAVEVAERYADGRVDHLRLTRAYEDAFEANRDVRATPPQREAAYMASFVAADAAWPDADLRTSPTGDEFSGVVDAAHCTVAAAECEAVDILHDLERDKRTKQLARAKRTEQMALANIMRDLFGNPFRSVRFLPAWRTDTVTALAKQIYEARDFGSLPVLADALQEAGCDNEDVLSHCRAPKVAHVRGCWVVDRVLDRS